MSACFTRMMSSGLVTAGSKHGRLSTNNGANYRCSQGKMRTTIERIGKYELKAPLARTPMSTVYDAWDTVIARRVALKLMPLSTVEEFDEREAFARFKR